ncbi:putative cytochrome P450 superfamily [Helianthus annuus]|uniref:Cytochrome P450 superfamily n=2 Tax=Helianthus annuus TaxID=4232 RepID=A0A9K3MVY6_HELAN|nr:putative cytochrome P450 superfamily [Helianthus annuus]KAJ0489211.1 putative cytochrome P450 superfamily [Helianthus annuus]KAJ0492945.1 putative cytochrome P450 superfamily [Helianthus annuus]KAJ0505091.1 putative cytochrome P450 superfamily [Helianthus annuus]KAJ0674778.1 putative cytochrome P450 superfamily [Helianthus annuus]
MFKGPWLAKMDMLCTASPADIHYILSKNFPNYPKGDKFGQIFDIIGDGFSNTDGELWRFHSKTLLLLLNHPSFDSLLKKTIWNKVEKGLLPFLDNISRQGVEIDLQEIFQRFGFDLTCGIIIDYDPESLSVWKLQRLLRMGNEKKLSGAWKIIDEFIYKALAEKRKEYGDIKYEGEEEGESFNFLRSLMRELKDQSGRSGDPNKFLRDISFNLILAGKGVFKTLFFHLTEFTSSRVHGT